jgi:hypothetical protein
MPDLTTLSTRELLKEFRASNNAVHKAAALKLIQEKNPYITYLTRIYTVSATTQVMNLLSSSDPQKNKFTQVPEVPAGNFFKLTPALLPFAATVEILEEALHQQAPKPLIAVARYKITAVVSQQDLQKVGQIGWTTRSNISAVPDSKGRFKVVKSDANVREAPVFQPGKGKLDTGRRVFIDEVKIDDFVSRNTFGLAVDADTHEEYGWISTTQLVGKMDSEIFGLREPAYSSKEFGHCTVGNQSAAILTLKGHHFALKDTFFALHKKVKIVSMADHLGINGLVKVAEVQAVDGIDLGWTTRSNISSVPFSHGFFEITAMDAHVRSASLPVFASTPGLIPQGAYVQVLETNKAIQLDTAGQFQVVAVSKITVLKKGKKDPKFENVWTLSANLEGGWADFKGPNAMWSRGNYIGQTAVLDLIGGAGTGGKQIAMNGGLGVKVVQMLQDARQDDIPISINSGFRDYPKQVQLAKDQPGNAANPGRSDHQSGNSMDLNNKGNKKVYEWLRQNAWKYGLVQTYPWYLGADGSGGEGHHWDYRPDLAKAGFYTFLINRFDPGVVFGNEAGQVDPRVKSSETWITGNAKGFGKGNFRIVNTATRKIVKLRKN